MIYAMSDIHGCLAPLNAALETVDLRDGRSKLILLGDYCDRGPDSLRVYERIMRLQEEYPGQVVALRGNHEEMLLEYCDVDAGRLRARNDQELPRREGVRAGRSHAEAQAL